MESGDGCGGVKDFGDAGSAEEYHQTAADRGNTGGCPGRAVQRIGERAEVDRVSGSDPAPGRAISAEGEPANFGDGGLCH